MDEPLSLSLPLSFTRYRLRSPNLFKTDYGQTAKWSVAAAVIMMRSDVKEKKTEEEDQEEDVGYVAAAPAVAVGLARERPPFAMAPFSIMCA